MDKSKRDIKGSVLKSFLDFLRAKELEQWGGGEPDAEEPCEECGKSPCKCEKKSGGGVLIIEAVAKKKDDKKGG